MFNQVNYVNCEFRRSSICRTTRNENASKGVVNKIACLPDIWAHLKHIEDGEGHVKQT